MKELCIIPCGNRKIWDKEPHIGEVEAKYAYTGTFHLLCRQYADLFYSDQWVILSAKHGFLLPEDPVPGSYNLSFSMKSDEIIKLEDLKKQAADKNLLQYERLIVLGGKKFRPIAAAVFEGEAVFPLSGCRGIGYMQQKLKKAIAEKRRIHC
ncbi:DUF6884 domain-containing protein [Metabacillus sp. SLBN-84]